LIAVALTVGVPLAREHALATLTIPDPLRERLTVKGAPEWLPHLSLLVLVDPPGIERVDEILAGAAQRTRAFSARARGYGVFAEEPDGLVLYAPVVRSETLTQLHRELFDAFDAVGARVDGHYHPDAWLPHITLCTGTLTATVVGELVASMAAARAITWSLRVDRITRLGPGAETSVFGLREG
jgi:2'-5' RNA ligase